MYSIYEIGEKNMINVIFYENKHLLLSQLLNTVPSVGEDVKIKGRKGKITSVNSIDEKKIHIQVAFEKIDKSKVVVDNSKKKKR